MAGYVITWDGQLSTTIPGIVIQKVSRNVFGKVRDKRTEVPGKDGDILFTERRGNRRIFAEGVIVSAPADKRAIIADYLAEWLDKSGYRQLKFDDQPDRYWEATLNVDPDPDEWKSLSRFQIEWSVKPYAYAISVSEECITATNGATMPLSIVDTVDAYPVVEITPINGDMDGFTFSINGNQLTYAGVVPQGTTITINSLNYTVTNVALLDTELTGVYTPGTVFPADVSGDFPYLQEGSNPWVLSWAGSATLVRVCISWRRRYR